MLLDFESITDKLTQNSRKHSCKTNACSQHSVMGQTDAIGLQKCDLGLSSSFTEAAIITTVRQLSNIPCTVNVTNVDRSTD
jgi:hypothetical protein